MAKRQMPIQEFVIFAYRTKGEALELANNTVEETAVAGVVIMLGLKPAEVPVAYMVVPMHRPLLIPEAGAPVSQRLYNEACHEIERLQDYIKELKGGNPSPA